MVLQAQADFRQGTTGSVVSLAQCVVAGPWQSCHTSHDEAEVSSLRPCRKPFFVPRNQVRGRKHLIRGRKHLMMQNARLLTA